MARKRKEGASSRRQFFQTFGGMGIAAAGTNLSFGRPMTAAVLPGCMGGTKDVPKLSPTLDDATWNRRLLELHKQLYASTEFGFDGFMTPFYKPPEHFVAADHCLVRDKGLWHLFYVTGDIRLADRWIADIRAGRFKQAHEHPYEIGDGHAVGPRLNQLEFKEFILTKPQGDFGLVGQDTSHVIRFNNKWLDVYTSRGPHGESLCRASSQDLYHWEMDPSNPFWRPPSYANPRGVCKNAFIIRSPNDPYYLIYYCVALRNGAVCVALLSTEDFKVFHDHGPVLIMTCQLRGTAGVETPTVVFRDGIWHLFFGLGPGVWHAVSNRPDNFMGGEGFRTVSPGGCYRLGRYHAALMFEHEGQWFFTSTRKEYQRYLNRKAGILKFRGSAADESSLLAGLFICEVKWKGDQPIFKKLDPEEIP